MRKTTFIILFTTMTFFGFSQEDWCGFNRFRADNERIAKSGEYPEVVFMGNSITEYWALYHPDFFSKHHYCGRGIGGQTSTQMLARFTADVVNLRPKAVVIMAGTNDVAHNAFILTIFQLAKTRKIHIKKGSLSDSPKLLTANY